MVARSFNSSVSWMWKINKNDLWYIPSTDELEDDNWNPYSDIETAEIEAKFQEKAKEAIFNDYRINFKHFMHISNWNNKKERLVKRITHQTPLQTNQAAQPKNGRFSQTPLLPTKSFGRWREDDLGLFLLDVSDHFKIRSSSLQDPCVRRWMVEKAAEGLIIEGSREGEIMAQELLIIKDGTLEQVTKKCAALYTRDTFLYRQLNTFMRSDADKEKALLLWPKVKTLGPFALLLSAIPEEGSEEKMTVYRSVVLNEDMIVQYRESEGSMDFVFPAFTSASRNPNIANFYDGNVILQIDIIPRRDAVDVSSYSTFEEEEEMLLNAYFSFHIRSCTYDIDTGKWTIHLQSINVDEELSPF